MRLCPTKTSKIKYNLNKDRVKVEGILEVTGASTLTGATTQTGAMTCAGNIIKTGANGQLTTILQATTTTGAMTGTTVTLTNLIPAGSLVLGVTARVLTSITGPTSWQLGITSHTDRFGTTLALTAGTTVNSVVSGEADMLFPHYYTSATSVLLTRGSATDFTAGNVRVTVHYISLTPATS